MSHGQSADSGREANRPPSPNEFQTTAASAIYKFRVENPNPPPVVNPNAVPVEPTPENPEPNPGPKQVIARMFDGQNVGKTDYRINVAKPHRLGATLYAANVVGTDPQEWIEILQLPVGARKGDALVCVDDAGLIMWTRVRFTKNP